MARIKVIQQKEAEGKLKEVYENLLKSRGKLAEIHQIQSLRPQSIVAYMDLYMELMYAKSELSRGEREMIGVVVSLANECSYCVSHHVAALKHYWKKPEKISGLLEQSYHQVLSSKEKAVVDFAISLTHNPGVHNEQDFTQELKATGLSDAAILDVVLISAYFNFVNRIVLSLGIKGETDNGEGYHY